MIARSYLFFCNISTIDLSILSTHGRQIVAPLSCDLFSTNIPSNIHSFEYILGLQKKKKKKKQTNTLIILEVHNFE